jgi:hypothetical protein
MENDAEDKSIRVNLVGIKHMKSLHVWRLEFDVYERENPKIKALFDQIEKDFYLLLVPYDDKATIDNPEKT